ncbi:MAG: ATP-NAD kinase family protein [Spongiibacter sp.]|nr:ATP-NAD kinase family protein [Spongiibacter sp.]
MFKLGLIVNPYAGLGGPEGFKGSDDLPADLKAGAISRAGERAQRCLSLIAQRHGGRVGVYGFDGAMAGEWARAAALSFTALGQAQDEPSTAADSRRAAQALQGHGVDLVLFVGGDGTARDICSVVGEQQAVLGLPAGVKMHSGVYAVSPEAAAEIVDALIRGGLVEVASAEVRDIDEAAFRRGQVRAKHYGEMQVPRLGGFLQQVKQGGREVEELVLADIAEDFLENIDDEALYIIGPGSTTECLMEAMGLPNTLLGFDLVKGGKCLVSDANAAQIAAALDAHHGEVYAYITAIGGQGHILGRGNQQLTPGLIRRIGRDRFRVVASKSKLSRLEGRPLLVDTNDPQLDCEWRGYIPVITGYRDQVMYRVGLEFGDDEQSADTATPISNTQQD